MTTPDLTPDARRALAADRDRWRALAERSSAATWELVERVTLSAVHEETSTHVAVNFEESDATAIYRAALAARAAAAEIRAAAETDQH